MIINIKNGILFTLLLLSALVFHGCGNSNENTAPTETSEAHDEGTSTIVSLTQAQLNEVGVTLESISHKQLEATIKANGVLRVPNDNKGNATSLYGGVVKAIYVQVGDQVKKGQLVATVANPQFVQMQEEYLTISSKIMLAEQELQRQQQLNAGNAGAKKNLEVATAELSALRTRKASLRQQLGLMGISADKVSDANLRAALRITSPINGTVSNVFSKIGAYVDASSPIVEVINNNSLHLDLQIFEKDLPKMKLGQIVHFNVTNNPVNEYDAKVFSVGSTFENDSKTISVHAKVLGISTGLIDGMNVTGMVSLNNVTTTAVPNEAVVEADGKYYIFIKTDKTEEHTEEEDGHAHDHGEEESGHDHEGSKDSADKARAQTTNFEKIEVVKGVSNAGYTGVTFVSDVPKGAKVVTKGAFFINAKMSNTGGHEH